MNYHSCFNRDKGGRGQKIAEDVCIRKHNCNWMRDGVCKFTPAAEKLVKKYEKKKEKKNANGGTDA